MISVNRKDLPAEIQEQLTQLQEAMDQNSADAMSWEAFNKTDTYQSLKSVLLQMFHGKCAYCERDGANHVEHHWPKSPHPHNANRGAASHMFQWNNMVLACSTCNGFECKGSHMEWETDGSPRLLNPCLGKDDALCYFTIVLESNPQFIVGWIDPRPQPDTAAIAYNRAEYTIRRLKLNQRDYLVRGRARAISKLLICLHLLFEFGPDYEAPSGNPIRRTLLQMFDAREPYLSPIRQILYYEPAYQGLKERLLEQVPEIGPIVESWALLPPDCSRLIQSPEDSAESGDDVVA
ncbi:MAG TPA: hypothetical protein VKU00_34405 [Chthonomonadaceae bacterium]|nr:hypothetical protein [Chthonomonadaceae bacterium]